MKLLDKEEKERYKDALVEWFREFKLSAHEVDYIFNHVECGVLRKKEFFSREDFVCKYVGLLLEGDLMAYSHNGKGEQVTYKFFHWPEDRIVTSYGSFDEGTASGESIMALSDCKFYLINRRNLGTVMEHVPGFRIVEKALLAKEVCRFNDVLRDSGNYSNRELMVRQHGLYPYLFEEPFRKYLFSSGSLCKSSHFELMRQLNY